MMKRIILLIAVVWAVVGTACHEKTVGFLVTENASYKEDTLYVRKTPDPKLDAIRMESKAPWISLKLEGYEGTEQIYFSVESVTSDQGEEAARLFMKDLSIRGGGALMYPFENDAIPGTYVVSIRLTNEGYSQVVKDAFTFIVVE